METRVKRVWHTTEEVERAENVVFTFKPFDIKPRKWLSDEEAAKLADKLEEIFKYDIENGFATEAFKEVIRILRGKEQ